MWIDSSFQTEEERMKKKHICDVTDEKQERKEIWVYLYTDKLQEINLMTNMKMSGNFQKIIVGKNLNVLSRYL